MYASISTSLEVVWISNSNFDLPKRNSKKWFLDNVVEFVTNQKNLKFLYYDCRNLSKSKDDLTEVDVSVIFDRCPSLRIFMCHVSFVKNVIQNRIQKFTTRKTMSELLHYTESLTSCGELEYLFYCDLWFCGRN